MVISVYDVIPHLEAFSCPVKPEDHALIEFYIKEVEWRILNSTNLDEIPEGLKYEWIKAVVADVLRAKWAMGNLNIEQVIKSIKEGDTTVSMDEGTSPEKQLSSILSQYGLRLSRLARYRKLVW